LDPGGSCTEEVLKPSEPSIEEDAWQILSISLTHILEGVKESFMRFCEEKTHENITVVDRSEKITTVDHAERIIAVDHSETIGTIRCLGRHMAMNHHFTDSEGEGVKELNRENS
jgi:hypothetical protein